MLELKRRNPANVANPDAGGDVLFLDLNGVFYSKDANGNLKVYGNGIVGIAKVNTAGLVDTYRITYDSGATFDYTVTNGQDGLDGQGQPAQNAASTIQPDDAAAIGTRTAFFALEDHKHAISAASPVALGDALAEGTSNSFARSDHVHTHGNRPGGTLHAEATSGTAGFMSAVSVQQMAALFGKVLFFVENYGTLVDGTDLGFVSAGQAAANTVAINAAIAAASSVLTKKAGGFAVLPPGTFHIDNTITINTSGVHLVGAGAYGNTDDPGTAQTGVGTSLFWNNTNSPATTAMIDVVSIAGATNPAVKNAGVQGITLQCAGNVGIGLRVKSIHWGLFRDIYVINPTNRGVSTECFITGTELGEAADVTKCDFERVRVRMLEVSDAAVGFYLDGAVNANTSNSTFRNIAVSCQGAQLAMDIRNTDSNSFYDVRINQSNGATVKPVRLRGGTAGGLEARGNVFYYLAAGGSSTGLRGIFSEGTETAGVTAPAKNNAIFGYSIENGEPYPVIGTGSTLFYQIIGGTQPFKLNSALLADTAFTNAAATVAPLVIPANAITAGTTFDFVVAGSVINTTAASNLVIDILINGAVVTTASATLGTTAVAAPGRGFFSRGSLTFRTAGAAASVIGNLTSHANNIANFTSNQVTPVSINTTNAVTLAIRVASSAATTTGTIRQATIIQGN